MSANGGNRFIEFTATNSVVSLPASTPYHDADTAYVIFSCFASGTQIATPNGETIVENLGIGDLIRTADSRDVAVKWLRRQTVNTLFRPIAWHQSESLPGLWVMACRTAT